MATLLPTNSPAPMMPPIEIIATCRGRSERLSCCDMLTSEVPQAGLRQSIQIRPRPWRRRNFAPANNFAYAVAMPLLLQTTTKKCCPGAVRSCWY
jgi:hypothetical protein